MKTPSRDWPNENTFLRTSGRAAPVALLMNPLIIFVASSGHASGRMARMRLGQDPSAEAGGGLSSFCAAAGCSASTADGSSMTSPTASTEPATASFAAAWVPK